MISHLKQYFIDRMTCSYKFGWIFLLCTAKCIFFGINVISTLSGLTYKNIEKMANKIFNVPNHLKYCFDSVTSRKMVMTWRFPARWISQ